MKFYIRSVNNECSNVYNQYKHIFEEYKTEVRHDVKYFEDIGYLTINFKTLDELLLFEKQVSTSIQCGGLIIKSQRKYDCPIMPYPTILIYDDYLE